MNSPTTLGESAPRHFPVRLWTEFVILGLGLPAAIWVAAKLIKLSIPAATHGSPGERFLWWIAGPAIAEWLFVIGVVFLLRQRQLSLKDIGVWRMGNWRSWVVCALFCGPFDRRQLALSSADERSNFIRFPSPWISPGRSPNDGNHRWLL